MVANVYPSRAAEKVIFREQFRNAADVARNGGTLVGAVDPQIKEGMTPSASDQGVSFPFQDQFAAPQITVVLRFNPDFDIADAGTLRFFLDTDDASHRIARFADNTLHVTLGGSLFGAPAISTFQAYWKVGEVNYLTIANDGANKFMWCNGQLFNSGAVAYAPTHTAATLYLGVRNNLTSNITGTLLDVSIHGRAFTQADVDAMEAGRLWSYMNRASVALDFKEATERGGLKQTLDKSPYGRVCLLGDGFTAADIPDFISPGFELDGANHFMTLVDGSFLNEDSLTLAWVFSPDYAADSGTQHFLCDDFTGLKYSTLKTTANALQVYLGGTAAVIALATYQPYWITNGRNVLVASVTPTQKRVWLNGHLVYDVTVGYAKVAVAGLYLWRRLNDTQQHDGMALGFYSWPKSLSQLQVADFTISQGVPA